MKIQINNKILLIWISTHTYITFPRYPLKLRVVGAKPNAKIKKNKSIVYIYIFNINILQIYKII